MSEEQESSELDRLVDEYLLIKEHADKLNEELETIKERLRSLGPGEYSTHEGVSVLITEPRRTFDVEAALAILPEAVRTLCLVVDPAKVKHYLSPQALEGVMRASKGKRGVYVR